MSDLQPYRVRFHVRCPARCSADEHEKRRAWALEKTTRALERQGYQFQGLDASAPRGPLPVVPIKGFPRRPANPRTVPLKADDALWRVSTLPQFGPKAAHLVTDEVDWEYTATFLHATIATEHLADA